MIHSAGVMVFVINTRIRKLQKNRHRERSGAILDSSEPGQGIRNGTYLSFPIANIKGVADHLHNVVSLLKAFNLQKRSKSTNKIIILSLFERISSCQNGQ